MIYSNVHSFSFNLYNVSLESISCQNMIWAASWENRIFAYAKTKAQISFVVTTKLISAFVFATRIVYFLFLYPKFQASSLLLWLYRPVCVRPGWKPRRPVFSRRGSYDVLTKHSHCKCSFSETNLWYIGIKSLWQHNSFRETFGYSRICFKWSWYFYFQILK